MFSLCRFPHSSHVPVQYSLLKACFRWVIMKALWLWECSLFLVRCSHAMLCFFVVGWRNKALKHSCTGLLCRRGNSIILWSCATGAHLVSGWARLNPPCNPEGSVYLGRLPLLLMAQCHGSQRLLGYCCYQTVKTTFRSSNDAEEHQRRAISHFHCRQSTSDTAMLAVKLYECFCWCYSTPTASIGET